MSSFVDDITTAISAANLGSLPDTLVQTSRSAIPVGPGPIVSLTETGGTGLLNRHDRLANPYGRPSMQIVVRATSAPVARARANAIFDLLKVVRNTTIGGSFYLNIMPDQSEPFDLGLDSIGRARFAFNIRALKTT